MPSYSRGRQPAGADRLSLVYTPPLGVVMLSGVPVDATDTKMAAKHRPILIFDSVRRDIVRMAAIPVSNVALRRAGPVYTGVIDSDGTPYLFALDGVGIVTRKATDSAAGWALYHKLLAEEEGVTLQRRRDRASDEQAEFNDAMAKGKFTFSGDRKAQAGAHHTAYRRKDPRTGKMVEVKQLGWTPEKPATPEKVPSLGKVPSRMLLVGTDHSGFTADDDHAHEAFRAIKRAHASTPGEIHVALEDYVHKLERRDYKYALAPKVFKEFVDGLYDHLQMNGAFAEDEGEGDEDDATWTTRKPLAPPKLPNEFEAKGTNLIINGRAIKLPPAAEHAAYEWAKRYVMKETTRKGFDKFKEGFERSLRLMAGLPSGEISYKLFAQRLRAEEGEQEGAHSFKRVAPVGSETVRTHPHLFVMQDGEPLRFVTHIPSGGFFVGKKGYGEWVAPLKISDITMNCPDDAVPKGWREQGGKVKHEPGKDYYLSWRNPVSGEMGYGLLSRKSANLKKFYNAATVAKVIKPLRQRLHKDITGKNTPPARRAAALCVQLIDQQHFRNGNEVYAADGTFGIASLRAKHIKIDGTKVTFEFIAKKEEPWKRTVDFKAMPEALAFIKQCLVGKKPDARLWEGTDKGESWRCTSTEVNQYLKPFSNGIHLTAKVFRTFHANHYMLAGLNKLRGAKSAYKLSDAEVKKLYKGIKHDDPMGRALLDRKVDGVKLRDYLEIEEYKGSKSSTDTSYGILPTVAKKLGHTTGACRGNYVDPVLVTHFAANHGWDERTVGEKRTREDLPGFDPHVDVEEED